MKKHWIRFNVAPPDTFESNDQPSEAAAVDSDSELNPALGDVIPTNPNRDGRYEGGTATTTLTSVMSSPSSRTSKTRL